ncbi:MAG: AMIN domain-containing protein, partial [Gammaproteobacteria bacterium]|nr:AMIN domain-containing protein [Gammaproteobacteria bacterium]
EIQASGRLGYETLTLSDPIRLVVDLPQSILVARQRHLRVKQGAVAGVRVGQFKAKPPITRLVVDLQKMIPYEVNPVEDGLQVTLMPAGPTALAPVAEPKTEPVAVARPTRPAMEVLRSEIPGATEFRKGGSLQGQPDNPSRAEPVLVASLAPTIPPATSSAEPESPPEPVQLARAARRLRRPPRRPRSSPPCLLRLSPGSRRWCPPRRRSRPSTRANRFR